MQRHISKVTSVCFYHLRRLCQIRNYVSQTVMAQLVMSLVITRIDYCNSILAGLPACRLVPLQLVQNAAARLVLNLDRRAHISPALQQLYWLPVKHRVTFKIATLMHQILQKCCPSYLADLVTFNTTCSQRRHTLLTHSLISDVLLPDQPPYDAHELSSGSVHFLFAVLMCGTVFLLRFVISTVIKLSDVHSSHIYLAVLFPHNCYPIYSLTW